MEVQFLTGVDLSNQIRRVCEADAVDCAVAFWGHGMRETLFPRWKKQKVRIVCDIAMQGTPRAALEELDAPNNKRLRVRDGLHAKVFVSSHGAVVCSANGSDNGVGKVHGSGGNLIEAGVFCPPGTPIHGDSARFFEEQFKNAHQIGNADLDRAAKHSREASLPVTGVALEHLSLLDRLRDHPELFERTSIALTTDRMDDEIVRARITAYNKQAGKNDRISRDDVFLQTEPGEVDEMERSVLLIHKAKGKRGFVAGYINAHPLPGKKPDIAIGKLSWPRFCKAVKQPKLKKKLSPEQWKIIESLTASDECLFTANRFAEVLRNGPA